MNIEYSDTTKYSAGSAYYLLSVRRVKLLDTWNENCESNKQHD